MAVLAATPRAMVETARIEKAGARRRLRAARFRSSRNLDRLGIDGCYRPTPLSRWPFGSRSVIEVYASPSATDFSHTSNETIIRVSDADVAWQPMTRRIGILGF